MATREQKNFLCLSTLLIDEGTFLLWRTIQHLLPGKSIEQFLDWNKHRLLHFWRGCRCCDARCSQNSNNVARTCLTNKQWETLFYNNGHKCRSRYFCVDQFTARRITSTDLNISLASFLLLNMFAIEGTMQKRIEKIRDLRNTNFAHITNTRHIDDKQFEKLWLIAGSNMLYIAEHIGVQTYETLLDRIVACREQNYEREVFKDTVNAYLTKVKEDALLQNIMMKMDEMMRRLNKEQEPIEMDGDEDAVDAGHPLSDYSQSHEREEYENAQITDNTDPIEALMQMHQSGCLTPEDVKSVLDKESREARITALQHITLRLPLAFRSCFRQCYGNSGYLEIEETQMDQDIFSRHKNFILGELCPKSFAAFLVNNGYLSEDDVSLLHKSQYFDRRTQVKQVLKILRSKPNPTDLFQKGAEGTFQDYIWDKIKPQDEIAGSPASKKRRCTDNSGSGSRRKVAYFETSPATTSNTGAPSTEQTRSSPSTTCAENESSATNFSKSKAPISSTVKARST